MTTAAADFDFIGGVDLPGELVDEAAWEAVHVFECAVCWRQCDTWHRRVGGICAECSGGLPMLTDCKLTLTVVAAVLTGSAGEALDHAASCPHCRDALGTLAALATPAAMEATRTQGSAYAARLQALTA